MDYSENLKDRYYKKIQKILQEQLKTNYKKIEKV